MLTILFVVFYAPLIINIWSDNLSLTNVFLLLVGVSLIYAYFFYVFHNTVYTIDANQLKIKCDPFKYKPIHIQRIRKVESTRSLQASPAASFDRMAIGYNKFDEIIISPRDKEAFVNHLKLINPKIDSRLL
jgi:hypothetical protein